MIAGPKRLGGELVARSLAALGAETVFGLPGVHALGMWEGLRRTGLRAVSFRTELSATFAADGWARVTGRPAPVILSTGPGALNSLTGIMEAASSHVPVVAVMSQIPSDRLGRDSGWLHELPDQLGSFTPLVKWAARARSLEGLAGTLAEAWRRAATPPTGPVAVEIPVDLLTAETSLEVPDVLDGSPAPPPSPTARELDAVAALLSRASRPVLWAGGGVIRSGAWEEVVELAQRLGAPVATTYMGRGAVPAGHPLAAGSGCDEGAFARLVGGADAVLAVGTELGAETTRQHTLRLSGTLVHVDCDPGRIGTTYPALPLVGDARAVLRALLARVAAGSTPAGWGRSAVSELRREVDAGLAAQGRQLERGLLDTIARTVPADAVQAYDMTILGYWSAAHQAPPAPRRWLYPLGSGTLGYAWPAAMGASLALPENKVLAVVGDGGLSYGLAELASARQHGLDVALLVVDDGGYGILREYQSDSFGATCAVDLHGPDLVALAGAAGLPVRLSSPGVLGTDLAWALDVPGPAVVVLRERLVMAQPTP
ncbi:MAG: thiamine pyrophosphate-binding protein [Actinomycetota bacterium]|nr:thiamine pyrophosphate-binding protein [Actinomycetota bacterium]